MKKYYARIMIELILSHLVIHLRFGQGGIPVYTCTCARGSRCPGRKYLKTRRGSSSKKPAEARGLAKPHRRRASAPRAALGF